MKERGRKEKGSTFSLGPRKQGPTQGYSWPGQGRRKWAYSRFSTEATLGACKPTQPEPDVTRDKAGAWLLGVGEVAAVILLVKSWLG